MSNSNSKRLLWAVAAVVAVGLGWYLWSNRVPTTTYASEKTIEGDHVIADGTRTVLAGNASLTVTGDLAIEGELKCDNGPLTLTVAGDLTINNGTLSCSGSDAGIAIVAMGAVKISESSQISSDGPIQIVSEANLLAKTQEDFERLYKDAETPGGKYRVGPFLPVAGSASASANVGTRPGKASPAASVTANPLGLPVAEAQDSEAVIDIAGKIVIPTPPKDEKKKPIIVFNFPGVDGVRIQNLDLQGPDGQPGQDDMDKSCNARGKDGGDAMRFLAYAGKLTVNNFTLTLGGGGMGGSATTQADCYPQATAVGGKGGNSGNFKMVAEEEFKITGAFDIIPGWAGDGGDANARAKDGGTGEAGGSATATGGAGANNIKTLGMTGTVAGVNNVAVGSMFGGAGGHAKATAGNGGNGEGCGKAGGAGGKATATGGKGGDARVTLVGGALRTPDANDQGGDGGDSNATGGKGGNGGSCDPKGPGGAGGKGGDAKSSSGTGGKAAQNGADGTKESETGGNGGNGGDGCKGGKGGKGGNGDPKGTDGADGKDNCVVEGGGGGGVQVPGGGANANVEVEVIRYGGKYIPVSQLMIEEHAGCNDAAHWHSKPAPGGPVKATDGSVVVDPGPDCGFGKTSNVPKMKITVPAAQIKVNLEL